MQPGALQWAAAQLRVRPPDAVPLLRVDGVLIEKLLVNLIENAAKYSPTGTVERRRGGSAGKRLNRVEDKGPGLPPGAESASLISSIVATGEDHRFGTRPPHMSRDRTDSPWNHRCRQPPEPAARYSLSIPVQAALERKMNDFRRPAGTRRRG